MNTIATFTLRLFALLAFFGCAFYKQAWSGLLPWMAQLHGSFIALFAIGAIAFYKRKTWGWPLFTVASIALSCSVIFFATLAGYAHLVPAAVMVAVWLIYWRRQNTVNPRPQ